MKLSFDPFKMTADDVICGNTTWYGDGVTERHTTQLARTLLARVIDVYSTQRTIVDMRIICNGDEPLITWDYGTERTRDIVPN